MGEWVSKNQDTILRGADQQQTTRRTRNLLYEVPSTTSGLVGPTKGLGIETFKLHNRAAVTIAVGIGFRHVNTIWHAGLWITATSTYTRSNDHQSRTAAAWQTTTAADGFIIASYKPFHWVSMNITTASIGATGDLTVQYSDEAGTGWITQSSGQSILDGITVTNGVTAAGEAVFVWNPPHDWGKTVGLETGLSDGLYAMRFLIGAQAYTTASIATGIEIGSLYSIEELADNANLGSERARLIDYDADGVVAFFETAAAGNMADFYVTHQG